MENNICTGSEILECEGGSVKVSVCSETLEYKGGPLRVAVYYVDRSACVGFECVDASGNLVDVKREAGEYLPEIVAGVWKKVLEALAA